MNVVLLKTVESLGSEGTVVSVKPGYARNYLIPTGLAVEATPQQLSALETAARQREQKAARVKDQALALKQKLESRSISLKLSVGEGGQKAFGAITVHDVFQALQQEQVSIDKHAIRLEEPIKSLGIFEVPVRLHPDVTATLKLWVVKA
jgi:large subunit ribosomal protein L9